MKKEGVTYCNMFWLFMFGNVLGVLLEGTWCRLIFGHWETHVATIWGPFSLIYGVGAVMFYISGEKIRSTGYKGVVTRFCSIAIVATVFELACGLLLEYGMGMKAWDYSKSFMNYKGLICLKMTLLWGLAGVIFAYMVVPKLKKVFARMQGKGWKAACAALSIFMIINLSFTLVCMVRWKDRHLYSAVAFAQQLKCVFAHFMHPFCSFSLYSVSKTKRIIIYCIKNEYNI